jgi:hypothetical protein
VLAPTAKLRVLVVPQEPYQPVQVTVVARVANCEIQNAKAKPGRIGWARLFKCEFDIDMKRCGNCGAGELEIIAAVAERPAIQMISGNLWFDPDPSLKGWALEPRSHFAD